MRILFFGDTADTGFGTVTADLGRALLARGVDVRFVSLNETPGTLPEPFRGRTFEVGGPNGWLEGISRTEAARLRAGMAANELGDEDRAKLEAILATASRMDGLFTGESLEGWTPDAAIVLGDVGALKVSPVLTLIPEGFPAWHYVPIEGVGLPPSWGQLVWSKIRPVAISEFGADEIAKVTGERPPVIYHGVDTRAFHPVSAASAIRLVGKQPIVLRSKADCRKFLGWPQDEFILFRADRHMPRKAYDSLFRAVAPVIAANPKVRLIVHASPLDGAGDMDDELSKYGPLEGFRPCPRHGGHPVYGGIAAHLSNTYMHCQFPRVDRNVLLAMYAAADLYVSTSAEGFGLTIAESLAAGTPAVGLRYSAVPEVIGDAGVTVPVGSLIPNIYSHFWAVPDERAFAGAIAELIGDDRRRALMGALGPIHVARRFSWARAAEQFVALVEGAKLAEVAA